MRKILWERKSEAVPIIGKTSRDESSLYTRQTNRPIFFPSFGGIYQNRGRLKKDQQEAISAEADKIPSDARGEREIIERNRRAPSSSVRGSGLSDCAAVSRSRAINYLRKARENFRNSRKISAGLTFTLGSDADGRRGNNTSRSIGESDLPLAIAPPSARARDDTNFYKKRALY